MSVQRWCISSSCLQYKMPLSLAWTTFLQLDAALPIADGNVKTLSKVDSKHKCSMSDSNGGQQTTLHLHWCDGRASRTVSATRTFDTSSASRWVATETNSSSSSSVRQHSSQFNNWLRTDVCTVAVFLPCSGAPFSSRNIARKHRVAVVGRIAVDSNKCQTSPTFTRHSLCFISAIIRCKASDWVPCMVTNLQTDVTSCSVLRTPRNGWF